MDKLLLILGLFVTILGSFGFPVYVLIYGEGVTLLVERILPSETRPTLELKLLAAFGGGKVLDVNSSMDLQLKELQNDTLAHLYGALIIGGLDMILLGIGIYLVHASVQNQIGRIRKLYFESLLRQDKTWYDTTKDINFTKKLTE